MVRENDEFCNKTEKFCIKNEDFCIKNDEFCSALGRQPDGNDQANQAPAEERYSGLAGEILNQSECLIRLIKLRHVFTEYNKGYCCHVRSTRFTTSVSSGCADAVAAAAATAAGGGAATATGGATAAGAAGAGRTAATGAGAARDAGSADQPPKRGAAFAGSSRSPALIFSNLKNTVQCSTTQ